MIRSLPGRREAVDVNAQQRAARVAADIQRSRSSADAARGVWLSDLGVRVKGNEVRKAAGTWKGSRYLGPLAGACAGVIDVKAPSAGAMLSSVVIGNVPRVGTIFVAFADGTRHEQPLYQGSPAQMRKVDAAVARFNAMADTADTDARVVTRAGGPRPSGDYGPWHSEGWADVRRSFEDVRQASRDRPGAGLSYRECKPGRDAYKAARRAGLSREEASQASRDALARAKEAKLKQEHENTERKLGD